MEQRNDDRLNSMRLAGSVLIFMLFLAAAAAPAMAFTVKFEWGDIPSCTTGSPNTVPSPEFALAGLPKGTATIEFHLHDLNVTYDHGGGTVSYAGGNKVSSGAFTYQSPCPPDGPHTYEWTITALDGSGKVLALAKAKRRYP